MKNNRKTTQPAVSCIYQQVILVTTSLALLLAALPAEARRPGNPGVVPPSARPYGHSYGEWGALWWRWALSIPPEINPLFDETGAFADVGQSGPVWFLAGTFGGEAVRTVKVPPGKALFFPIVNNASITTCNGEPRTIDDFRPQVAPAIDATTDMAAEIDGTPVQNLPSYRAESPLFCTRLDLFGILTLEDLETTCLPGETNPDCLDLPNPDEHFGPADGFGPAFTDGVWLMVAPLSEGQHTIHFAASRTGFALDVTCNITVVDEPEP